MTSGATSSGGGGGRGSRCNTTEVLLFNGNPSVLGCMIMSVLVNFEFFFFLHFFCVSHMTRQGHGWYASCGHAGGLSCLAIKLTNFIHCKDIQIWKITS